MKMKKMMKLNVCNLAILLVAMTLLVTSCEKDEPKVETKTETNEIKEKNISDFVKWHYFSFEKGEFVGEGSSNPEDGDDAKWAERTDWDIAFHYTNVRTNGGTSGKGKGAVLALETEDFESVKEVSAEKFSADTKEGKVMHGMPPKFLQSSYNSVISDWYAQGHGQPATIKKKNVFIIKTATGKYAKIQLTNVLNSKDEARFITVKYTYQKDGSKKFK